MQDIIMFIKYHVSNKTAMHCVCLIFIIVHIIFISRRGNGKRAQNKLQYK